MRKLMAAAVAAVVAAPVLAMPTGAIQAQEVQTEEASEAAESSWIHVRVDEPDGTRARVNLPMSMAEVALEAMGEEALEEHAHWGPDGDMSLDDIRGLWRELRDAEDAEYVEVRDGDEHVRIFREGDRVRVHVDDGEEETVRIEMPSAIVDALLGTEGDELDLMAAVRELARSGSQDLVQVRDGETTVRVWVDTSNTQPDNSESE